MLIVVAQRWWWRWWWWWWLQSWQKINVKIIQESDDGHDEGSFMEVIVKKDDNNNDGPDIYLFPDYQWIAKIQCLYLETLSSLSFAVFLFLVFVSFLLVSESDEEGVDVELTLTSFSLSSSLEVLLTSTTTSFFGSTRTKLRHWKVRWPPGEVETFTDLSHF